ncbi:chaplin [Kitasatospora sp. NPDC052896]|uniref:chaplin n=1 Tax=Kitasatospora sp. NPDC052896 TaxID=3364061 RepID=UPI0037C63359
MLASTAGYAYASADADGVAAGSPGVASGNTVQVPVNAPINLCGNTVDVVGVLNPAYGNHCGNASTAHVTQGGQLTPGVPGAPTGPGVPGGSGAPTGQAPTGHLPSVGGGVPGVPGTTGSNAPGGTGSSGTPVSHLPSSTGSTATGVSQGSPGLLSGNTVQTPVDTPVNVCGNTANVVGVGNPAMGNGCANHETQVTPPVPVTPPQQPPVAPPVVAPPTAVQPVSTPIAPMAGAAPVAQPVAVAQAAGPNRLAFTGADGLGVIAPAGLALLVAGGVLYRRSRTAA